MSKFQHGSLPVGVWEDGCVIPPSAINPTGPSGSMTVITSTAGYTGCLQADAVGESCTVNFQIPHSYMSDTDVHPHVHVVRNDGADNIGKVEFTARFRHCPLNGTATAWSADIAGSTGDAHPADGVDETGLVAWNLAATDYGFGISDVIVCIIERSGTETGSVAITSADLHVQKAQYGSIYEAALKAPTAERTAVELVSLGVDDLPGQAGRGVTDTVALGVADLPGQAGQEETEAVGLGVVELVTKTVV